MFFMRIYYDKASGEVISSRWAKGSVILPPYAQDFAERPELTGRTEENTGLFEWLDEEAAPLEEFGVKKPVVDISQDPPILTWVEWPEPDPTEVTDEDEISDSDALKIITGEVSI